MRNLNWRKSIGACVLIFGQTSSVSLADSVGGQAWDNIALNVTVEADAPLATDDLVAADRLRHLSREIPALACLSALPNMRGRIEPRMVSANEEFVHALTVLEYGHYGNFDRRNDLKPGVLRDISAVKDMWRPISRAVRDVGSDRSEASASLVEAGSVVLHDLTLDLYAQVQTLNSNSFELSTRNAVLIDVAGRPEMLLHEMIQVSCDLATGNDDLAKLEHLKTLATRFEQTLTVLSAGMPQAGVVPPPTEAIVDKLQLVQNVWEWMDVSGDLSNSSKTEDVRWSEFCHHLTQIDKVLAGLVELYADQSKPVL